MTTCNRKPNPRREQLKALSQTIKPLVQCGMFNSINEGIQESYIEETGQTLWHTFHEWKDEGFNVVKGQHGFPVWATPRKLKKDTDKDKATGRTWYPIAYIFHAGQVQAVQS